MNPTPPCVRCGATCRDVIAVEGPHDFCSYRCLENYQDEKEAA